METFVDLARLEVGALVDSVIDTTSEAPFGSYAWPATAPEAEVGRFVERQVFGEVFGNSPELLAAEYAPFDDASVFFCIIDHRRRVPAGAVRTILPSSAGLKTLVDIEEIWKKPLDDVLDGTPLGTGDRWGEAWDVATLAVGKDYRGPNTNGLISLALYQAICATAARAGIDIFTAVLDAVVLDLIQDRLHGPFQPFRGVAPRPYLDSPLSVAVWASFRGWCEAMETQDPALYETLALGAGLEPAVSHGDWQRAADLVRMVADACAPVGSAPLSNRSSIWSSETAFA